MTFERTCNWHIWKIIENKAYTTLEPCALECLCVRSLWTLNSTHFHYVYDKIFQLWTIRSYRTYANGTLYSDKGLAKRKAKKKWESRHKRTKKLLSIKEYFLSFIENENYFTIVNFSLNVWWQFISWHFFMMGNWSNFYIHHVNGNMHSFTAAILPGFYPLNELTNCTSFSLSRWSQTLCEFAISDIKVTLTPSSDWWGIKLPEEIIKSSINFKV